jgi:hypothetical protein
MANGDEGISIPAVPKPIPRPITKPDSSAISERGMPQAPAPGKVIPELDSRPVPATEKHIATDHFHHKSPPPLFIKIDKYQEVVENMQKLKSLALSLRDALDALADIEKELTTGISIAHKALDDFNTIISMMNSKFTRVGEIGTGKSAGTSGEVNAYVKDIYSQMDKIRQDLKNVSEEV